MAGISVKEKDRAHTVYCNNAWEVTRRKVEGLLIGETSHTLILRTDEYEMNQKGIGIRPLRLFTTITVVRTRKASEQSSYQGAVTFVSLFPEYGGLRNQLGSNWKDSASLKPLACRSDEV